MSSKKSTKIDQNPVFYQIFVQSFADSNGDGWGDLQGIISKLSYISELGVDGIWLTPIYQSPLHDNGYDVADYYHVNPRYGSLQDAEELIHKAHELGLKVIFDLVVNHTSWDHEWFQKSCQKIAPYTDYYVWTQTPNDWHSKFGGSAWEYNDIRGEYYLHLFSKPQPDLNWENPKVREEVKNIIRFWAQKGIDGFRLDVINLISKNQQFPNDPETQGQKHYTDGPRVVEFFTELGQVFDEYGLFTVGELSSSDIPHSAIYTNPKNKMLSSVFSFKHLSADWADTPKGQRINSQLAKLSNSPFSLIKMKRILKEWQGEMLSKGGVLSPCWGNHDQPRIVSRFGNDTEEYRDISAKMLCIGQMFLSGVPFIFQGEELGMTNYPFNSLEEFRDVETLGAIKILEDHNKPVSNILEIVKKISRENAFAPMQWNDSKFAGFSTSNSWVKVNPNYTSINAEAQKNNKESVLSFYQKVLQIRKEFHGLSTGIYDTILDDDSNVWAYTRKYSEGQFLILCNFSASAQKISHSIIEGSKIVISNYDTSSITESTITLQAYEGIVLQITN